MMLQPALSPPARRRPSTAALAGVLLAHALLLWLINQYWPIAPAVRYVVYQTIRTITPRSGTITPPTVRPAPLLRAAPSLSVFTRKADTTVPLKTTLTLPEFTPAKTETAAATPPQPQPAEKPAPAAVEPPSPVPVPPAPPASAPTPPAPVLPSPVPPPPVAVPAPAPTPVPVPPTPVPTPPAPTLPKPEPAPVQVPTTVAAPPAPLPVPAPPVALPAAAAPLPAPAQTQAEPAALPYAERLRAPVIDVPVQAGASSAAQAVTVPVLAPAAGGTAGNADSTGNAATAAARPGGVAAPAPAPASAPRPAPLPIAQPFVLPPENNPYRYQPVPRGRSLADMANEQLRRGKPADRLADGMAEAGVPDCTQPGGTGTFGGLLAAPALAMRALQGRCR